MTRIGRLVIIVWLAAAAAAPNHRIRAQGESAGGEIAYQEALKAVAIKDYATALARFEDALSADPDHLGYGNDYRRAVIQVKEYDRCISFFKGLVARHPEAANAYLNYGFAIVDKIPDTGAVSQLILANNALPLISKALELRPSWLAYATRGNSHLYWPRVFNHLPLAVSDLEHAMSIQRADTRRSYHVRTYIYLGDARWKMDQPMDAQAVWREGLQQFPENAQLRARLAAGSEEELKSIIDDAYDTNKRIDTNVEEFLPNR
jgi:tetratricopeptide (TPR) repeat protein